MKKIIILSPSGAIAPALIHGAAARLRQWGFSVEIAPSAMGSYGRFAATPADRLADLQSAIMSDADYVICSRGGYGLAQIIDQIVIPAQPQHIPVFIGFSDITALHCLMGHASRRSIHGCMCKALAADPNSEDGRSAELLHQLLLGHYLSYNLPAHPLNRPGDVTGMLRGGNLSILYSLQATPFACPIEEGDILFIEDVGEHPYAIDRMMQNLRLSGVLARLGGLIVGQFSDYEEDPRMPYSVYEGIRQLAEPYDYPILFNFPAGHVDNNQPLLLNQRHCLRVSSQSAHLKVANNSVEQ